MTTRSALAFVRKHGVVLEAARGPAPSFAEFVAGTPIRGGWWSHPKGREIFALSRAVRASDEVLVCRLLQGKVTFVHRRLWPALVRAADQCPSAHLARVYEVHTASGRHVIKEVRFPEWVPSSVRAAARALSHEAALEALSEWIARPDVRSNKRVQPTAAGAIMHRRGRNAIG